MSRYSLRPVPGPVGAGRPKLAVRKSKIIDNVGARSLRHDLERSSVTGNGGFRLFYKEIMRVRGNTSDMLWISCVEAICSILQISIRIATQWWYLRLRRDRAVSKLGRTELNIKTGRGVDQEQPPEVTMGRVCLMYMLHFGPPKMHIGAMPCRGYGQTWQRTFQHYMKLLYDSN